MRTKHNGCDGYHCLQPSLIVTPQCYATGVSVRSKREKLHLMKDAFGKNLSCYYKKQNLLLV